MISTIYLKQLNYINEQLGFTLTWKALYELKDQYAKYHQNKKANQNIASWDFHCGRSANNTNTKNIIISRLRYYKRSQCTKSKKKISEMTNAELLEIAISHKCAGHTATDPKFMYLPFCKSCGIMNVDPDHDIDIISGSKLCGNIIFDVTKHPVNRITKKRVKCCGFNYCFELPFDIFVADIAEKYHIDLRCVGDWQKYDSSINPLSKYLGDESTKWRQKNKGKIRIRRIQQDGNELRAKQRKISIPTPISNASTANQQISDQTALPQHFINPISNISNSNVNVECISYKPTLSQLSIEHQTNEHFYASTIPKIGKIKTEKIFVDSFRKELMPYINSNFQNKDVKKEVQKICNKYFFRFDQAIEHKKYLKKMQQKQELSYFDNIFVPDFSVLSLKCNETKKKKINPMQIIKNWMISHKEQPLKPPFTTNELLNFFRHSNNDKQIDQDDLHDMESVDIESALCLNDVISTMNMNQYESI